MVEESSIKEKKEEELMDMDNSVVGGVGRVEVEKRIGRINGNEKNTI